MLIDLFWVCLAGGVIFSLFSIVAGDLIGEGLHSIFDALHLDAIQPLVLVGGLTIFGGTGLLLAQHTDLPAVHLFVIAFTAAVLLSMLLHFGYVRPMQQSETSIGYSVHDYVGKIGEVLVPIPAAGCGEVLVKMGPVNTAQIAASFIQQPIPAGAKVVVVEVREHTLHVIPFEDDAPPLLDA